MLGNVLAATLRNLARNRLYAAISIGGLALGMAAALLTALFVHDELTFDRFIPGYERVFVVFGHNRAVGRGESHQGTTDPRVAAWLRSDFPQISKVARYRTASFGVRSAKAEATETLAWLDPDFFSIMPLPVLAGDPATTIQRPDGVVLTRAMARKYFGKDAPIGETLQFARTVTMRVGAVIADLPGNSNIQTGILASGRGTMSTLNFADAHPPALGTYQADYRTYVLLRRPADAASINAAMPGFIARHLAPRPIMAKSPGLQTLKLELTPVATMHLEPDSTAELHPDSMATLYALAAIALLILLLAGVNFVNLQTARSARRAVEVGIRKTSGGSRLHLVVQFIGESLVYAGLAMVLALALAELSLPALAALVRRPIAFAYWTDPSMTALAVGLTVTVGLAAGAYPALVLSSFPPSTVLRDGLFQIQGAKTVRHVLVASQFAVLIALLFGVVVVYAQTRFALNEAIGLDKDQMLQVSTNSCRGPFAEKVRAMPGVARVGCSSIFATGVGDINQTAKLPDGSQFLVGMAPIDFGFFETFNVRPIAGRLPSAISGDGLNPQTPQSTCVPARAVVNLSAVRAFHYAGAEKIVGATVPVQCNDAMQSVQIIGVVPDLAFNLTTGPVKPMLYPVDQRVVNFMNVKIRSDQLQPTLAAIDQAWARYGLNYPVRRRFLDEYLNRVYADLISQGWLLAALCAVAGLIAGLGLFGLAAFTTEQRTKEIGVRKAMGASIADILRLLLWSFVQPVAWASLIAAPVGAWVLNRWLQGFSAHVQLSPWFFLAAIGGALIISVLTVAGHSLRVAGAPPAMALRCE